MLPSTISLVPGVIGVLGGLCSALAYVSVRMLGRSEHPLTVVMAFPLIAGPLSLPFALAGALRHYRGVNETISSLLLSYTAIALFKQFVEGPLRRSDPENASRCPGHLRPASRDVVRYDNRRQ